MQELTSGIHSNKAVAFIHHFTKAAFQTFTILGHQTALRKIFSILILCCLVIYIGGYHLVYIFYQYNLKQEMRVYLQTHNDTRYGTYLNFPVVKNEVSDPAFEWEETDAEFSYQGALYDVVSVQRTKDSIRICALKDDRENDLEKQIAGIRHSKQDRDTDPVLSLLKFFSAFEQTHNGIVFLSHNIAVTYRESANPVYVSCNTEIHSPPPRGC